MATKTAGLLATALALAACGYGGGPAPTLSPEEQSEFTDEMAGSDPLSNSEIPPADSMDPN